jgi:ABC-2 type transport system ATP-binding protein
MNQHNNSDATEAPKSPILLAEDLRKFYGPRLALRGLSFSLEAGRVLGFLGPNGAGKTTAIRILTTILEPSSGHYVVDGISCRYPERIRHRIGVLPENQRLPKENTPIEYLTYFGRLYGRTAPEARTHALALIEIVGLQRRARSLIGSFSHGMRQRLGIARALVNDPVVVFLDEPTLGLDPRGQEELLSLVRRIATERNAGVVLCSHHLSDIEGVCDEVVILNAGQVIAAGSVSEVIGRAQRNAEQGMGIRIRVPSAWLGEAEQVLERIPTVVGITSRDEMTGWLRAQLAPRVDVASVRDDHVNNTILDALIRSDIPIMSFEAEGGRLHDAFLALTEGIE